MGTYVADSGVTTRPMLILFSGPCCANSKLGEVATALQTVEVECKEFDIINGSSQDLADDAVWGPLLAGLQSNQYAGVVSFPPSATFSKKRPDANDSLRGSEGKQRYGLAELTIAQMSRVRLHNLLVVRAAQAFKVAAKAGLVACICGPKHMRNAASMFGLDEFLQLKELPGVKTLDCVQCSSTAADMNAPGASPVTWLYHGCDLSGLPRRCTHEVRMWQNQVDGTAVHARHPPEHWGGYRVDLHQPRAHIASAAAAIGAALDGVRLACANDRIGEAQEVLPWACT